MSYKHSTALFLALLMTVPAKQNSDNQKSKNFKNKKHDKLSNHYIFSIIGAHNHTTDTISDNQEYNIYFSQLSYAKLESGTLLLREMTSIECTYTFLEYSNTTKTHNEIFYHLLEHIDDIFNCVYSKIDSITLLFKQKYIPKDNIDNNENAKRIIKKTLNYSLLIKTDFQSEHIINLGNLLYLKDNVIIKSNTAENKVISKFEEKLQEIHSSYKYSRSQIVKINEKPNPFSFAFLINLFSSLNHEELNSLKENKIEQALYVYMDDACYKLKTKNNIDDTDNNESDDKDTVIKIDIDEKVKGMERLLFIKKVLLIIAIILAVLILVSMLAWSVYLAYKRNRK